MLYLIELNPLEKFKAYDKVYKDEHSVYTFFQRAFFAYPVWRKIPGALSWLKKQTGGMENQGILPLSMLLI